MQPPSTTQTIGKSFTELQSVDSTNNYALARIHEGMAFHGDCFFAHEQTKGKGQRGKSWATERSQNITLSIVLKPEPLQIFQQFQLSACVAVATHQFISNYGGKATKIKWPNDLYWNDKKIGGILIESVVGSPFASEGQQKLGVNTWQWAVVGIGINVNQTKFPDDLSNAVSLKKITGKSYDVVALARELCRSIDRFYKSLLNDGFAMILNSYNDALYKKNQKVKLKKNNRVFQTVINSISETGQLVTHHAMEERFNFGEVEWLL